MNRTIAGLVATSPLWASACASSTTKEPQMPEPPAPDTRASLAGPLCGSKHCKCAELPSQVGKPPEGHKRFKVTLRAEGKLWASIDDNSFYKGLEQGTNCFYVDLAPGDHTMSMHAQGHEGFGALMQIQEVGGPGPWFYDSFTFQCGVPGLCSRAEIDRWKAAVARVDAGKHDPCGSVRVVGLDWVNGRAADDVHPGQFYLKGTLKLYKFVPRLEPGSEGCTQEN